MSTIEERLRAIEQKLTDTADYIAELEKDRERLDWLEAEGADVKQSKSEEEPGYMVFTRTSQWIKKSTLRQAIDAAIATKGEVI